MKKVLFITDRYVNNPSANGICVNVIAQEFSNNDYEVHILCMNSVIKYDKKKENESIYGIKPDIINSLYMKSLESKDRKARIYFKLFKVINRLFSTIFLPWFPMRSPLLCKKYFEKIESLHAIHNYDVLIASYRPFEGAYGLYKLKEKYDAKTCLYTLDSLSNFSKRFFMSGKFQNDRGFKWEKRFYNRYDLVLNPLSYKNYYSNPKYNKYKRKMRIMDFPYMKKYNTCRQEVINSKKQDKKYELVYAGSMREEYFHGIIDVLEQKTILNSCEFVIYGNNSHLINKNNKKCKIMGCVDHEKMIFIEANAFCLISVGNTGGVSKYVPSKIFEYMSFGGKIIHFYYNTNDSCLPYYIQYDNVCLINMNDDINKNRTLVKQFIFDEKKRIPFNTLKDIFYMNTPEYTFNTIKESLDI